MKIPFILAAVCATAFATAFAAPGTALIQTDDEASGMTRPSGGGCVAPWSRAASCEVILLQAALVHAFLDNRTG
jgi:hypothetical protein